MCVCFMVMGAMWWGIMDTHPHHFFGAPFSEAGLKALALVPFQFPQQFVGCYHQRSDTPHKVTIEPLENVLKLTLEWIRCGGD